MERGNSQIANAVGIRKSSLYSHFVSKRNYTDVMQSFTGLMKYLIRHGVLAEDDPEIMAAQLCLPISMWINLCDREPDREAEVMELVSRHIQQFFRVYQPEAQ